MAELIDKKLVLKDIASWAVGGNPEEPEMVRIDELATAMGVSIGRLPTTTEADIRAKAYTEVVEKLELELSESIIWGMALECDSEKIVDYVIDTAKRVSEQLRRSSK